ncbi:MAG: alginate lyase family protein [Pseudomonadota bacterium]
MTNWYFNRLQLMSFPEMGLRLYRRVRHRIWETLLPLVEKKKKFSGVKREEDISQGEWLTVLVEKFPITLGQSFRERYARYFSLGPVKEEAEKILSGRIPVFKKLVEYRDEGPDWHRDMVSQARWPKVYFTHLNHNEVRYGGVLNVWELNRHFHFYDFGKAFSLTGDERYAQTLITHLESWIDQNPPGIGINWYSSLEIGVRLISWLWGLFFISDGQRSSADRSLILTPEKQTKILQSIYWQAFYIEKNLSKYSSANNHRVGEALGLFWVGSLIPSFPQADRWKEKGWKILCQEIELQIFPDGVPREQSTRYLFFLFDLYSLAVILAQKEGRTIPSVMWNRLEKICEFIMALMDEEGHLPDLGDSADGQACKLYAEPFNPYRSMLISGAVWFNRADFKAWGGKIDERNYWLFSKEAIASYLKMEGDIRERESTIFPQGGQIILRKGEGKEEAMLSMDAGPFGYLSIAAHAHADALAFTLNIRGKAVLIDPGTYLYHDGWKWRDYFKGTRAHNTIEIDGQDQALSGGPFMWLSKPEVSIEKTVIGPRFDYIQAFHTGYERLNKPLRHERSIFFSKKEKFWIIKDRLSSEGPHAINQMFHFHPQCHLTAFKGNLFQVTIESGEPILYLKIDSQLMTSLHQGEEDPVLGWFSPAFGEKVPSLTLKAKKEMQKAVYFKTIFWMP